MALTLPILPPNPNSISSSFSFFFPSKTLTLIPTRTRTRTKTKPSLTITSSSSSSPKITRFPSLDRHATTHNNLRFVRKLTTLLLSKPQHFIPLKILNRCRHYLSLPPKRPLLQMLHRYPSIFTLSHFPPSYLLSVSLTPNAFSLFSLLSTLQSQHQHLLTSKLHRLLLLSQNHQLPISKLVHIAPDLALPPNFRAHLCNSNPSLFHIHGPYLHLTHPIRRPPLPLPPIQQPIDRNIIAREPKFKFTRLNLRKGLNLKRKHLDYLVKFWELPEVNPYVCKLEEGMNVEEKEKRACAVVREVLGMTVEKRTLVDHLTHFRTEFGLPNKLRGMLVRHPEMFYVSVKGVRDSVFLVEGYDEKGRLVVDAEENEIVGVKRKLEELVREGKRIRRERRRGIGVGLLGGDEEEDDNFDDFDEVDDGFGDLFESGIGEDWEEIDGGFGDIGEDDEDIVKFWSMNGGSGEGRVETW